MAKAYQRSRCDAAAVLGESWWRRKRMCFGAAPSSGPKRGDLYQHLQPQIGFSPLQKYMSPRQGLDSYKQQVCAVGKSSPRRHRGPEKEDFLLLPDAPVERSRPLVLVGVAVGAD